MEHGWQVGPDRKSPQTCAAMCGYVRISGKRGMTYPGEIGVRRLRNPAVPHNSLKMLEGNWLNTERCGKVRLRPPVPA
jgi:hypothetical protein